MRESQLEDKVTDKSKTLVAVAMSGGIDSSVAAVMLKQQGYDVIGLTMKLWDFAEVGGDDKQVSRRCCSLEMFEDARSVCFKYGIPHYVLNMHKDFHDTVISDFVSEYVQGRTPNPCVVCNYKIKWELLENKVKQLGCDYLATGHYARIEFDESNGRYQILKGVDLTRDQSYFLWGLKQESLARTMFPLGDLRKTQVRELGREYGLINAEREESREICFVPDNNYARLVEKKHPELAKPGNIRDTEGNVVGTHDGYFHYTIGQRKRIQINTTEKKFVTQIDAAKNEIVIGDDEDLLVQTFEVKEFNWVAKTPSGVGDEFESLVRIRYLHKPVPGSVRVLTNGNVEIRLHDRQRAVTPGQSCVLYDGDIVLGGGKIA